MSFKSITKIYVNKVDSKLDEYQKSVFKNFLGKEGEEISEIFPIFSSLFMLHYLK